MASKAAIGLVAAPGGELLFFLNIAALYDEVVKPPQPNPTKVQGGFAAFEGCIGALDAVDHDDNLTYLLAGYEGSANDTRVLNEAKGRGNLPMPENYYYLADAGYSNKTYLLVPYRSPQYHLNDWSGRTSGTGSPQTLEGHSNLRHSKLRNVVERAFGLLKRRWRHGVTGAWIDEPVYGEAAVPAEPRPFEPVVAQGVCFAPSLLFVQNQANSSSQFNVSNTLSEPYQSPKTNRGPSGPPSAR
ncbi:hypothetical protein MBLNU457_3629t1 [Dothideomycetes sp. NU457]